jgi:hypothetical protein
MAYLINTNINSISQAARTPFTDHYKYPYTGNLALLQDACKVVFDTTFHVDKHWDDARNKGGLHLTLLAQYNDCAIDLAHALRELLPLARITTSHDFFLAKITITQTVSQFRCKLDAINILHTLEMNQPRSAAGAITNDSPAIRNQLRQFIEKPLTMRGSQNLDWTKITENSPYQLEEQNHAIHRTTAKPLELNPEESDRQAIRAANLFELNPPSQTRQHTTGEYDMNDVTKALQTLLRPMGIDSSPEGVAAYIKHARDYEGTYDHLAEKDQKRALLNPSAK